VTNASLSSRCNLKLRGMVATYEDCLITNQAYKLLARLVEAEPKEHLILKAHRIELTGKDLRTKYVTLL